MNRDRRALVLGAGVITGLIVGFRGLPAWRSWRAEAEAHALEAMSQAQHTEATLAGFADSLNALEGRTARMKSLGPALVVGETPAEAASNLAVVVAELARSSLVRLDAVESRTDTARARVLPRVSLEAQATGDVAGLAALLQRLEQGPPLLAVRRLSVRPQSVESPADQVALLTLRFTVEGLALVRKGGRP